LDYAVRFLAGGLIVSAFAILGDVLRPKSFAGLFGAAPSVALATLSLAFWKEDPDYVATEGCSMILGAAAFLVFAFLVCHLLMRIRLSALAATASMLAVWLVVALCLKQLVLG
jgi:uncharacterized membrane protein (GlpM family)